ncbi:MAG: beta-glucoside system component [Thermoanaerobacteraceae bacterium]|nr:beta-glucoside system component [Thermoanaerobacteraceae bacterium]
MIDEEKELTVLPLYSPVSGLLKPLEKLKDPVFSQKIVGDGIAIVPCDSRIYSPCDGYAAYIHEARHAMFIKTAYDFDVLLHVGIDTLELKGRGFDLHVRQDEKIRRGQLLWEVDLAVLKSEGKPSDVIICIPGFEGLKTVDLIAVGRKVEAVNDMILRCVFKREAGKYA